LEEVFKDLVRGNDMKTPIPLNSFLQRQVRLGLLWDSLFDYLIRNSNLLII